MLKCVVKKPTFIVTAGLTGIFVLQPTNKTILAAISRRTSKLLAADMSRSLFGLSCSLRNDNRRHPRASKLKFLRDRIIC
jgi:hypothetical protein